MFKLAVCEMMPNHANMARRQCFNSFILSVSKSSLNGFVFVPISLHPKLRGSKRQPG